ncbi:hypothetical protein KXW54_009201, partial [Aspergillus fumigatus]
ILLSQKQRSKRPVSNIWTNDRRTCCGMRRPSALCLLISVVQLSTKNGNGKCRHQ